jgi:glycosyltransferase involved in cell wall biosynthesis
VAFAEHPLRVIQVFRAPVGGLFRHVADLTRLLAQKGHQVGLIADSSTGGPQAEGALEALRPALALGIERVPMSRNPHPSDLFAQRRVNAFIRANAPDIVHGHGAKGGFYARLPGVFSHKPYLAAYTPHGGSLNYHPGSFAHKTYMKMERLLEKGTGLFLFESQFVSDRYQEFVGRTDKPVQVFVNGIHAHEFMPVVHDPDASDLMFIGELRMAEGIDILLDALADVRHRTGRTLSIEIVGSGPDEAALRVQAERLGLAATTKFLGAMPARKAFQRGRIMVMPSRFESLPYVVLEAVGCAQPQVVTRVGGIPEVYGPESDALIAPNSVDALVDALIATVNDPHKAMQRALRIRDRVMKLFSAEHMTETVIAGYRLGLARRGMRAATQAGTLPVTSLQR